MTLAQWLLAIRGIWPLAASVGWYCRFGAKLHLLGATIGIIECTVHRGVPLCGGPSLNFMFATMHTTDIAEGIVERQEFIPLLIKMTRSTQREQPRVTKVLIEPGKPNVALSAARGLLSAKRRPADWGCSMCH